MGQHVFIDLDPAHLDEGERKPWADYPVVFTHNGDIALSVLPKATAAGKSGVYIWALLPDHTSVVIELTASNFLSAAAAVRGRLLATGEIQEKP